MTRRRSRSSKGQRYRVTGKSFVAELEVINDQVSYAEPKLRSMMGWIVSDVFDRAKSRGWSIDRLEEAVVD
jgi:phage pi2 protein 07